MKETLGMPKLEYTLTNDVLFKMLFRDYPDLRKRLVAGMLGVRLESIGNCVVTNPEMPPNPAVINFNYLLSFSLFFEDGALPRNAPIR